MGRIVVTDRTKPNGFGRRFLEAKASPEAPLDRDADDKWTRRAPPLALSANGQLRGRGTTNAHTTEIASSHAAFISHPNEVVKMIEEAAK
jgi:hypothetical protein